MKKFWFYTLSMVFIFGATALPLLSQGRIGSNPVGTPSSDGFSQGNEVHPMFFFGRVMREDGSPPPVDAVIELECHGYRTREAAVSVDGTFSFQIGGDRRYGGMMPDASRGEEILFDVEQRSINSFGMSTTVNRQQSVPLELWLAGCDLRAHLPGFRSTVHVLRGGTLERVNNVGQIIIYPADRVKGTTISAAGLSAPRSARSFLQRGKNALENERLDEAEKYMTSAIAAHPEYGEAHLLLGQVYQKKGLFREARESLLRAIATDPLYVNPYVQLAWLSSEEQNWKEVVDATEKVLSLDPLFFPEAYYMSALAYYHLGNFELAERRSLQAQQRDHNRLYPKVHLILANIYNERNEPEAAIREMRMYLRHTPDSSDAALVRELLERAESRIGIPAGQ
ncbi:MAG TPA: tetratricopeptide repeat protein [Acidobacteriota bacterium]|nr:tetratricopeptide repeat protein [Acidobacteriota bacterium]